MKRTVELDTLKIAMTWATWISISTLCSLLATDWIVTMVREPCSQIGSSRYERSSRL